MNYNAKIAYKMYTDPNKTAFEFIDIQADSNPEGIPSNCVIYDMFDFEYEIHNSNKKTLTEIVRDWCKDYFGIDRLIHIHINNK